MSQVYGVTVGCCLSAELREGGDFVARAMRIVEVGIDILTQPLLITELGQEGWKALSSAAADGPHIASTKGGRVRLLCRHPVVVLGARLQIGQRNKIQ